jgi:tetratricopeptide (TPR) repeat protein
MFELLLQADKSLADGALEQAERTYWQLVDLDPSNAIAFSGLARVALARGDERLARDFAGRALDLDPESVAARHVLEILEHSGSASVAPESHAQEMIAARSLEILGRRIKVDGARVRIAPEDEDEIDGPTPAPVAAEAVAAPVAPVRARHEPHQAMPLGRRYFEPEALRVPLADQFSKAEMAAAIEAVEAIDDVDVVAMAPEAQPTRGDADSTAETLDAIEATKADESVAMRIALMSDAAVLDNAESASAEVSGDTETTEAELAEADATIAMRIALLTNAAGMVAAEEEVGTDEAAQEAIDEFEAAEFLAGHQAAQQNRAALKEVEAAARLESAEATFEVAVERPTEPEIEAPRRRYARTDDEDASEEEAEAQALREALAIVLGGEGDAVPGGAAEVPIVEAPVAEVPAADTSKGKVSYEARADAGEPRKKGLFRRFRGK